MAVIGTAQLTTASHGLTLKPVVSGSPATAVQLPAGQARPDQYDGISASTWTATVSVSGAPTTLSLDELTVLSGGRLPVGLNPQQHPGPFAASWSIHRTTSVWTADGVLLDADQRTTAVVSVSGSGLDSPRTLSVDSPAVVGLSKDWQVSPAYQDQAVDAVSQADAARTERSLWAIGVPIALAIAALLTGAAAGRSAIRLRRAAKPLPALMSAHQPTAAPTELS